MFFSRKAFWVIKSEQFFLAVLSAVKILPAKSIRIIKPNPACTVRRYQQAASHCSVITLAPGLSCVTGVTQTNDDLYANVKTTARDTSSFLIFHTCFVRQWGGSQTDSCVSGAFLSGSCITSALVQGSFSLPFNSEGQQALRSSRCFLLFVSESRRKAGCAVSPEVHADVEQAVHVTVLMQGCIVSEHDHL